MFSKFFVNFQNKSKVVGSVFAAASAIGATVYYHSYQQNKQENERNTIELCSKYFNQDRVYVQDVLRTQSRNQTKIHSLNAAKSMLERTRAKKLKKLNNLDQKIRHTVWELEDVQLVQQQQQNEIQHVKENTALWLDFRRQQSKQIAEEKLNAKLKEINEDYLLRMSERKEKFNIDNEIAKDILTSEIDANVKLFQNVVEDSTTAHKLFVTETLTQIDDHKMNNLEPGSV
jgi:hypothetical protein